MSAAPVLSGHTGSGAPTRLQLNRWAKSLREIADLLTIVEPNGPHSAGSTYAVAKASVDQVADEMYAANDAMARGAWDNALGKGAAS